MQINFFSRNKILFSFFSLVVFACKSEQKPLPNPYLNDLQLRPSYLAMLDTVNYTTADFPIKEVNVGNVAAGDSAHAVFQIRNTGSKLLFIAAISSECGCTVPSVPDEPIQPGETVAIKATYNSKGQHPGSMHKRIIIETNTQNNTRNTLTLSGEQLP